LAAGSRTAFHTIHLPTMETAIAWLCMPIPAPKTVHVYTPLLSSWRALSITNVLFWEPSVRVLVGIEWPCRQNTVLHYTRRYFPTTEMTIVWLHISHANSVHIYTIHIVDTFGLISMLFCRYIWTLSSKCYDTIVDLPVTPHMQLVRVKKCHVTLIMTSYSVMTSCPLLPPLYRADKTLLANRLLQNTFTAGICL
jgi:hypothetical protein